MIMRISNIISVLFIVFITANALMNKLTNINRNNYKPNSKLYISDIKNDIETSPTLIQKPKPKVPASAWRWPPSWPFPADYLAEASNFTTISISDKSIEALNTHLNYFLPKTSNVLELGLPEITIIGNIGSSESKKLLLSELLVNNIDKDSFDDIIISAGVESIVNPREFFKKVWSVLKPGGSCNICFYKSPPTQLSTSLKMWTTMTNEQKVWIAGSYYHYSIGKGWLSIEGYDVFDETITNNQITFGKSNDNDSVFVVRAIKRSTPSIDDEIAIKEYIESNLNSLKNVGVDDLQYLPLRLVDKTKELIKTDSINTLDDTFSKLSSIYGVLKELKEDIIPKPIQAMLAMSLVDKWSYDPSQISALRTGLGLETPDENFWLPVTQLTANTSAKAKIALLIGVVNNWENKELITSFPISLQQILLSIKSKVSDISENDAQTLAAEFAISEVLLSTRQNSLDRVLKFINNQSSESLNELLNQCKR